MKLGGGKAEAFIKSPDKKVRAIKSQTRFSAHDVYYVDFSTLVRGTTVIYGGVRFLE